MPTLSSAAKPTLFYREWGTGQPVLFVSSWALSSEQWQLQMIQLTARNLRCIAYDRRGHGRSDDPGSGYDYDTLADDLATLIGSLGLHDVVLVGHSMGCGEVLRYVTRHGRQRVAKLVLLAPAQPLLVQTEDNPGGIPAALLASVRESWAVDFGRWINSNKDAYVGVGLPGCDVSKEVVDWTIRDLMRTSLQAVIEFSKTGVEADFRPELQSIDLPTLVIQGDHDASFAVERTGCPVAELMPNARLVIYENAPNGLYLTHARRLNQDLLAFIG